jgi:trigger factor
VKEVREVSLPEVDAEFAKSFGVEDGDVWKLKNEVKENLNRELDQRISRLLRERVLDALLAVNDIEVPKKLVDQEIDRTIESNKAALAQQGISVDDVEPDRSHFEADARRRVLLGVILRKIVEERQLKPDDAVVRARIERTAEGYEDPQAFVQWYYSDNKRLLEVQSMVLEEQVVEELLKSADVTDEKILFSRLVGE